MSSSKNAASRPAPAIARATERTRSVIEDLQSKLTEVGQHAGASPHEESRQAASAPDRSQNGIETEAELERQLQEYFAREACSKSTAHPEDRGRILNQLRERVVDRVVERILDEWAGSPKTTSSPLREEVLERLTERVLEQFGNSSIVIKALRS